MHQKKKIQIHRQLLMLAVLSLCLNKSQLNADAQLLILFRGAEGRNERSLPARRCAGGRELPSFLISRSSQVEALGEFAPSSEPAI